MLGHIIPDKAFNGKELRPDGSVGKLFAQYLRDNHPELSDKHKMYSHKYPSGLEVQARQYENEVLHIFIKYVEEVWIPTRAGDYFKNRDPKALDYLPKLISAGAKY